MGSKTARNEITHDKIKTKPSTDKYRDGWERIFKKRKQEHAEKLAAINNRPQDGRVCDCEDAPCCGHYEL